MKNTAPIDLSQVVIDFNLDIDKPPKINYKF